jgi:hypothetical protein
MLRVFFGQEFPDSNAETQRRRDAKGCLPDRFTTETRRHRESGQEIPDRKAEMQRVPRGVRRPHPLPLPPYTGKGGTCARLGRTAVRPMCIKLRKKENPLLVS